MKLIITGGSGFIGSAVVARAVRDGHCVLNVDNLTYASHQESLFEASAQYQFIKADIGDSPSLQRVFSDFNPDAVLHLAAESHVDRSIERPLNFITTNVIGTFVLLEVALGYWSKRRAGFKFIHVSTDEVFGSLSETGIFNTNSRYEPRSPYAASKAASDHLVRAWHHTYGLPIVVTNCSNNYGPRQHAEKLIPTVLRKALAGDSIPIYGNGSHIRDWIYVDDHVEGLFASLRHGRVGATYLFGGRSEMSNLDLCKAICAILDETAPSNNGRPYSHQIEFVEDRPGHDFRYAIDPSQAERDLSWRAKESLTTGLRKTVEWYLGNPDWLKSYRLERLGLRNTETDGDGSASDR